jgi:hypothetical protein
MKLRLHVHTSKEVRMGNGFEVGDGDLGSPEAHLGLEHSKDLKLEIKHDTVLTLEQLQEEKAGL